MVGAEGALGAGAALALVAEVEVVEAWAGSGLVCEVDEPLPTFASPADLGV